MGCGQTCSLIYPLGDPRQLGPLMSRVSGSQVSCETFPRASAAGHVQLSRPPFPGRGPGSSPPCSPPPGGPRVSESGHQNASAVGAGRTREALCIHSGLTRAVSLLLLLQLVRLEAPFLRAGQGGDVRVGQLVPAPTRPRVSAICTHLPGSLQVGERQCQTWSRRGLAAKPQERGWSLGGDPLPSSESSPPLVRCLSCLEEEMQVAPRPGKQCGPVGSDGAGQGLASTAASSDPVPLKPLSGEPLQDRKVPHFVPLNQTLWSSGQHHACSQPGCGRWEQPSSCALPLVHLWDAEQDINF